MVKLVAGNTNLLKASLFSLIVDLLRADEPYIQIFINSKEYEPIKKYLKNYFFTNECLNADIIFVDRIENLPSVCRYEKKIFVTRYRDYIKHRDLVVGAFFWQKGRPNIIFNREQLEYFGIQLPQKYEKYIE